MVGKVVRAVVPPTVGLVACAAAAAAECAWVLWGDYSEMSTRRWEVVEAATSKAECEQARTNFLRRLEREGWKRERAGAETPLRSTEQQLYVLAAACLPDTVDPRGPKMR
jgi:hypothetical protein